MAKLTAKQQRFVEEYLVDLNATQAAIRAGYSAKNAGKIGPELLGKTRIQEAINTAMQERGKRTEITVDRVLAELGKIAFTDVSDYLEIRTERILVDRDPETMEPISEIRQLVLLKDTADIPPDKLAAISEVKQAKDGSISYKLHDKKGALDSIAKHLGMFIERHEHAGKDGGALTFAVQIPEEMRPSGGSTD